MTVKELIEKLQQFDPDTPVVGSSYEGECDFPIDEVAEVETNEDGLSNYYCQGDTSFADCGKVVVIAGGSR